MMRRRLLPGRSALGTALHSGGGAAVVPAYLAGSIPLANCVAAYEPVGAASLAASLVNKASPGTHDATVPVLNPAWSAANGWEFTSTNGNYLATDIVPAAGWSAIIKFSGITATNGIIFGVRDDLVGQQFLVLPNLSSNEVRYSNGIEVSKAPGMTEGVLAIAGSKGYRNGVDDGVTTGSWVDGVDLPIWIGKYNRGGVATLLVTVNIQVLYIYNTILTAAQVAAVYARIADPFFDLVSPAEAGEFMLVHLTDTHYGGAEEAANNLLLTQFVADHATALGVEMVMHGGDLIYSPLDTDNTQWVAADAMIDRLDTANVPYLITAGNHDYDADDSTNVVGRETTKFNAQFPQARYTAKDWWSGGFFEAGHSENAYCIRSIGGADWIFITLEFGPRQAVIDWANALLTTHALKHAIIITHSYLYRDGTTVSTGDTYNPHDWTLDGDINDGSEMWTELIKLHDNIRLVLSGHDKLTPCSVAQAKTNSDGAVPINQMLANYQQYIGQAIRFIRINPTAKTIKVETGSPYFSQMWRTAPHQFTVTWE